MSQRGKSDSGRERVLKRLAKEADDAAAEIDSTYAHIRAVIENCKHMPVEAIRHQLVGLLPEVREMEPTAKREMREHGLGHLVERHEWMVQGNWADYGYGEPPEGWAERDES